MSEVVFRSGGAGSEGQQPGSEPPAASGRYLVAVIGIDQYQHLRPLENSASDARGVLRLFTHKLGFERVAMPLFNRTATRKAILDLLTKRLPSRLSPDDNLVLYYAGHGLSMDGTGGVDSGLTGVTNGAVEAAGFLAPVDASECPGDCLALDELLRWVDRLPARRILVILDACYSGVALYSGAPGTASQPRPFSSRKVITSTRRDRLALDRGRIPDHSPFTQKLIEGLDWGRADIDGNGVVTSNELGLYVQQKVEEETSGRQKPDYSGFGSDDREEMAIDIRRGGLNLLKIEATHLLAEGEFERFTPLVMQMSARYPRSPETLYFQYRQSLLDSNFKTAIRAVQRLRALDLPEGACPLSRSELEALEPQMRYWLRALAFPETIFPQLQISMLTGPDEISMQPARVRERNGRFEFLTPGNSVSCFQVLNLSQETHHLYLLTITDRGRLKVGTFLEDETLMVNGLPPGATGLSHAFRIKGTAGLRESRVFIAPRRIMPLLCPPVGEALEFARLDRSLLEGIEMMRVWNYTWLDQGPGTAIVGAYAPLFG